MYANGGLPHNGMPQPGLDPRTEVLYDDRGELGGYYVDPVTNIVYDAYTQAMPDPKVMREPPTIRLGEPNRMLEALTGVSALKRPCKREMENDFTDLLDGLRLPQGLVSMEVTAQQASRAAASTFFTNRETPSGFNDTHWDGYLGTQNVLRPVIDTQTVADNDNGTTTLTDWMQAPSVPGAFQISGVDDPTRWGGSMQPGVTVLAEDRAWASGRRHMDMPEYGQGMRYPQVSDMPQQGLENPNFRRSEPNMAQYGYAYGHGGMPFVADVQHDRSQAMDYRRAAAHVDVPMPYSIVLPGASDGDPSDATAATRPQGLTVTDTYIAGQQRTAAHDGRVHDAQLAYSLPQSVGVAQSGATLATVHDSARARDDQAGHMPVGTAQHQAPHAIAAALSQVRDAMEREGTVLASHPVTANANPNPHNPAPVHMPAASDTPGRDASTAAAGRAQAPTYAGYSGDPRMPQGSDTAFRADAQVTAAQTSHGQYLPSMPYAVMPAANDSQQRDAQAASQYAAASGYSMPTGAYLPAAATRPQHDAQVTAAQMGHGQYLPSMPYTIMPAANDTQQRDARAASQYASSGYSMPTGAYMPAAATRPQHDAQVTAAQMGHGQYLPSMPYTIMPAANDTQQRDAQAATQYASSGYNMPTGAYMPAAATRPQHDAQVTAAQMGHGQYLPSMPYTIMPAANDTQQRDARAASQYASSGYNMPTGAYMPAAATRPQHDAQMTAAQMSHGQYLPSMPYTIMPAANDTQQRDAQAATQYASSGYTMPTGAYMAAAATRPQHDAQLATAQHQSYISGGAGGGVGSTARVAGGSDSGRGQDSAMNTALRAAMAAVLPSSVAAPVAVGDPASARDSTLNAGHMNHGYAGMFPGGGDPVSARVGPGVGDGDRARDSQANTFVGNFTASGLVPGSAPVAVASSNYTADDTVQAWGSLRSLPPGSAANFTMPTAADGVRAAKDDVARTQHVPVGLQYVDQPLVTSVADRVPTNRTTATAPVSNSRTLFWTGQSIGAQDRPAGTGLSEMDSHGDARDDFGPRAAHVASVRDSYLQAHPSTFGLAAEFRNKYYTNQRKGHVEANLQTQRADSHPNKAAFEAALAAQMARADAAQANPDPVMCRTMDAYESDVYASDMESGRL
jgi:hypothetical protein